MRISSIFYNRIVLPLKVLVNDISNKEVQLGFVRLFASIFRGTKFSARLGEKQHSIILKRLKEDFGDVLEKFKNYSCDDISYDKNAPIWVSWLQGYELAPPLVKKCIDSIKKSTEHPVHLITMDNIKDFIEIPSYILDRYKDGKIINAHFADILRVSLLAEYGGLWIDATVFIPHNIPELIFESEFYTCKRKPIQSGYISNYKWTSFIIGCQKDCLIPKVIKELFLKYLQKKDYIIDYLLLDYFMFLVYDNIPHAKELIDNLPYNNSKVEDLQRMMNMPFNEDEYKKIIETDDTIFYKLSWRMEFINRTDSGEQTFFDFFLNEI